MKLLMKLAFSAFLLLITAACNQETVTKTSIKTDNINNSEIEGSICNIPASIANDNQVPVRLTKIVNGNTIKVIYNGKEQTVRYLLIDIPDEKKAGICEQPYAIDAINRTKQLLQPGYVTLEFEEGISKTDQDGRLQAYVFVNGTSVQETLLKEGLARIANINKPNSKYVIQYIRAQTEAKKKQLNIWSRPDYVTESGFNGCANSSAGL